MAEKPVNLNVARASKAGDSRLQTVKDCLEQTLSECDDFQWDKALIVLHRKDGNQFLIDMRCAGVTTLEARGLMLSWIKEDILGD